jgi:hypothetical protein
MALFSSFTKNNKHGTMRNGWYLDGDSVIKHDFYERFEEVIQTENGKAAVQRWRAKGIKRILQECGLG